MGVLFIPRSDDERVNDLQRVLNEVGIFSDWVNSIRVWLCQPVACKLEVRFPSFFF